MTIHASEPIGCVFEYDRGRWVQTRSNIPEPEAGALIDGEQWVPNQEAVCHANGIVIIRGLIGAFGRAKMEVREEDGMDAARFYRLGRDWLLKFGYDEDGNRPEGDAPDAGRHWMPGQMLKISTAWVSTRAVGMAGHECHRRVTRPINEVEVVAAHITKRTGIRVRIADLRREDDGWRPEGSSITVTVKEIS